MRVVTVKVVELRAVEVVRGEVMMDPCDKAAVEP